MVVRFPNGSREYRYPEKLPSAGDVLWHDGEPFRIISVNEDAGQAVVIVEPASPAIGDRLRSEEGGIRVDRTA